MPDIVSYLKLLPTTSNISYALCYSIRRRDKKHYLYDKSTIFN